MKTMNPPVVAPLHDVAVRFHSDGNWWATCLTCGWHGPPCSGEQAAMGTAGQHHRMLVAPNKKTHKVAWTVGLGILAFIAGVAIVGVAAVATETHTVTYQVEGTTKQASITYRNSTGDTSQQSDIDVPMIRKSDGVSGLTLEGMHRGDFLYISAQNSKEYGTVSCSIEVDGVTVKRNTSSGGYTIATCSGRL